MQIDKLPWCLIFIYIHSYEEASMNIFQAPFRQVPGFTLHQQHGSSQEIVQRSYCSKVWVVNNAWCRTLSLGD